MRSTEENDHAKRQAEQAEEVRHRQVEEEALRHGGAVKMLTERDYHGDVGGDTKQTDDCDNHTSTDVPEVEAGGQRRSRGGAAGDVEAPVNTHHGWGMKERDEGVMRLN